MGEQKEVIEKIKKTAEQYGLFRKGDAVVIGLSGGPDSVCLTHVLHNLRELWDLRLFTVHLNHRIRGADADRDEAYAVEFCRKLDIPCRVFVKDIIALAKEEGLSTEDAGRKYRYLCFEEERRRIRDSLGLESGQVKIAVAQNENDQAETVLMRIMRGTGTEGLRGIEYKRKDGVVRPLLDVSRKEVEAYCSGQNLDPCIDKTNLQPDYTRNRIRLELLPYMEEHFNKGVISALNRLAAIAAEDSDFIEGEATRILDRHLAFASSKEHMEFPVEVLKKQHPSIRKRLILQLLKGAGLTQNITALHMKAADDAVMSGKRWGTIEFPGGFRMYISDDRLKFYRGKAEKNEYDAEAAGKLRETVFKAEEFLPMLPVMDFNENVRWFDLEAVRSKGEPLVVRYRRSGDFIRPLGMKGTKKMQDYFVDKKIPRKERDRTPLVCIGKEVIWVTGGQISENFKIKDDTEHILLLEYEGNL